MAKSFKVEEWDKIYSQLDGNDHLYDLPDKSSNSIVFGSWNIRHFGEFWDGDTPKRSAGSTKLIVCLLYTSPSPRDKRQARMPSSA